MQFAAASNPIVAYVAGCKRGKLPKEMESAMILRLAFRPRIRGSNLGECDRRRSQLRSVKKVLASCYELRDSCRDRMCYETVPDYPKLDAGRRRYSISLGQRRLVSRILTGTHMFDETSQRLRQMMSGSSLDLAVNKGRITSQVQVHRGSVQRLMYYSDGTEDASSEPWPNYQAIATTWSFCSIFAGGLHPFILPADYRYHPDESTLSEQRLRDCIIMFGQGS